MQLRYLKSHISIMLIFSMIISCFVLTTAGAAGRIDIAHEGESDYYTNPYALTFELATYSNSIRYIYKPNKQLVKATTSSVSKHTSVDEEDGSINESTDEYSYTETYKYDKKNRMIQGGNTKYTYYSNGKVKSIDRKEGRKKKHSYSHWAMKFNKKGYVTSVTCYGIWCDYLGIYNDGVLGKDKTFNIKNVYSKNKLTSAKTSFKSKHTGCATTCTYKYSYDDQKRIKSIKLTRKDKGKGELAGTSKYNVSITYNSDGQITRVTNPYKGSKPFTYTYYTEGVENGLIKTATDNSSKKVYEYTLDADNDITQIVITETPLEEDESGDTYINTTTMELTYK